MRPATFLLPCLKLPSILSQKRYSLKSAHNGGNTTRLSKQTDIAFFPRHTDRHVRNTSWKQKLKSNTAFGLIASPEKSMIFSSSMLRAAHFITGGNAIPPCTQYTYLSVPVWSYCHPIHTYTTMDSPGNQWKIFLTVYSPTSSSSGPRCLYPGGEV